MIVSKKGGEVYSFGSGNYGKLGIATRNDLKDQVAQLDITLKLLLVAQLEQTPNLLQMELIKAEVLLVKMLVLLAAVLQVVTWQL